MRGSAARRDPSVASSARSLSCSSRPTTSWAPTIFSPASTEYLLIGTERRNSSRRRSVSVRSRTMVGRNVLVMILRYSELPISERESGFRSRARLMSCTKDRRLSTVRRRSVVPPSQEHFATHLIDRAAGYDTESDPAVDSRAGSLKTRGRVAMEWRDTPPRSRRGPRRSAARAPGWPRKFSGSSAITESMAASKPLHERP